MTTADHPDADLIVRFDDHRVTITPTNQLAFNWLLGGHPDGIAAVVHQYLAKHAAAAGFTMALASPK